MSQAGRSQLIKSVFNSLPQHYLSIFQILDIVAKKISKLQRRFFWGDKDGYKGLCYVKWEDLKAPIKTGGLGFGNLKAKNLGLLFKWWWKFSLDGNLLWKKLVTSVHSINTNIPSKNTLALVKSGPFKELVSAQPEAPW